MLLTQLHFKLLTGAPTPAPRGMPAAQAALPTHSFGDVDPVWIQIFGLHVRCRLVLWWQPHCFTVCKVASAPLLQTKVALSPRVFPKLHGLCHQHCHLIKWLLSLFLTHHFLLMDVDCCLTCTSVIPMIVWFIVLALGLFKSPFRICDHLTDGLPHALSSALLLFHARPWKHLPQLRCSFSSEGPTPSLSAGWLLLEESKYHGASERPGKTLRTVSTRTNASSGTEWRQKLHCSETS